MMLTTRNYRYNIRWSARLIHYAM